ncbi:MAG TPA: thiamine phosphate synthase [Nitrospiria bacterium]|nr:thiamine phosphate synthase [Nitrospiria bacterium]
MRQVPRLYLIADGGITGRKKLLEIVDEAISAGIRLVQYREKLLSRREIFECARLLRTLTRERESTFIVNDYLDIAMAVDADGLHIGLGDLPLSIARKILGRDKIIGVTAHNLTEAREAEKGKADYIGLGPIFETKTKETLPPVGIGIIKTVKKEVSIPIFAISGINRTNLDIVLKAGAYGAAISSAIIKAEDIGKNVKELLDIVALCSDIREPSPGPPVN